MISYEPIRENREFQRVYARGKCYVSPVLVSYVFKNKEKVAACWYYYGEKNRQCGTPEPRTQGYKGIFPHFSGPRAPRL